MNNKPIKIYERDIPDSEKQPTLTPYLLDDPSDHDVVIIFPGGGYEHVSIQKEGELIAEALNAENLNAFVLDYRVAPSCKKEILSDAVRAVQYVRYHSSAFGTDGSKLAVMGFSAGGHLALMEAEHWQEVCTGADALAHESARPDGLILCYPVVTFCGPYTHRGSRNNFLGADHADDTKLQDQYSAEKHILPDFPPAFIWHCEGDASVPIENSYMLRDALEQAGVDHRLITYPGGAHGLGLAPDDPVISGWFAECVTWLQEQGYK